MMAQAVWSAGGRVSIVLGVRQLSTRMYDGLSSLIKGWGKNVYAGGRFAMRGGSVGRTLYPLILLTFPSGILAPFVALLWALAVGNPAWMVWSALASVGTFLTFALANRLNRDPMWRAVYAPLGGAVLLVICLFSLVRGRNVSWKGRGYLTR
jgi:chlorobactene glucosyltransferase